MARRQINRLSPAEVKRLTDPKTFVPGMHHDGRNLYLEVKKGTGTASWILRYMLDLEPHWMGLGGYPVVGLADARRVRDEQLRILKIEGIDPVATRKAEKARRKAEKAKTIAFKTAAEAYIKAHRASWRNEKHAAQWSSTLEDFVFPVIGDLAVGDVDTGHVTKVLTPIWTTTTETASRVRGRIEAILDYAATHGWRTGENPARWKGHLQNVLPARAKVAKVEHHAALPWLEIGSFMTTLCQEDGTAALALRFTILTAARTGEVIGAQWSEIDWDEAVWTVPGDRMKAGKEHRKPLAAAALAVLREVAGSRNCGTLDGPIFRGGRGGKGRAGLSDAAMQTLLRRMNGGTEEGQLPRWRDAEGRPVVPHGFRSTFRDWAAETGKPNDIAEAALAHTLGDKTQAAYQRGDLLQRRRVLMDAWADFCGRVPSTKAEVVTLRPAGEAA